jgi:tetratricopeptide (TPR) repeat protein
MQNHPEFPLKSQAGSRGRRAGRVAFFLAPALLVAAAGAFAAGPAAVGECGDPFSNGVGPFDYNNGEERTNPAKIPIVEKHHFNRQVESLTAGQSSEFIMSDLDYTLRAVPNHHRALNAVARYDLREKGIPPRWHSAQCWFDRATLFRPDDGQVWLVYANWMARKNRNEDALEAYGRAKALLPNSAEVDYNMGLLYFNMGDFEKSLASAKAAYAGNYPLPGLRRKLAERGFTLDD